MTFKVYASFVTDGLPAHLTSEKLIDMYINEQKTRMQLLQAIKQTTMMVSLPQAEIIPDRIINMSSEASTSKAKLEKAVNGTKKQPSPITPKQPTKPAKLNRINLRM